MKQEVACQSCAHSSTFSQLLVHMHTQTSPQTYSQTHRQLVFRPLVTLAGLGGSAWVSHPLILTSSSIVTGSQLILGFNPFSFFFLSSHGSCLSFHAHDCDQSIVFQLVLIILCQLCQDTTNISIYPCLKTMK